MSIETLKKRLLQVFLERKGFEFSGESMLFAVVDKLDLSGF